MLAISSLIVRLFLTVADLLELFNAVHTLGLFGRVDEAAKCRLELFATRTVGHATKTRAVPVDLAGFGIECALLVGLLFQVTRRARRARRSCRTVVALVLGGSRLWLFYSRLLLLAVLVALLLLRGSFSLGLFALFVKDGVDCGQGSV